MQALAELSSTTEFSGPIERDAELSDKLRSDYANVHPALGGGLIEYDDEEDDNGSLNQALMMPDINIRHSSFDGIQQSHSGAQEVNPSSTALPNASVTVASGNHEDCKFPEWLSMPQKYLVSDSRTYFAYFKAFVGGGVLFLPSAFKKGGLTTSVLTFVVTTVLSTLCMIKLAEAKNRLAEDFQNGNFHGVQKPHKIISFGMLGRVALGRCGRWFIDISVGLSQFCFVTIGLVFVSKNLHGAIWQLGNCESAYDLSITAYIWILVPILLPMMFIRQLAKFTASIIIADSLIILGLLYLYYRSAAAISLHGGIADGLIQFDFTGFWPFLGTALLALEGTAFVLPIEHQMQNKENFNRITWISGLAIGAMYMSFGLLGYLAFGSQTASVITLNLKNANGTTSFGGILIQLGYSLAIMLSMPISMFPAARVVEAKFFPALLDFQGNKIVTTSRTWMKNGLRTLMTITCAALATVGGTSFDNFVSLIGGLMCVPLTLVYPAYFHLKICGDRASGREIVEDYVCIVFGLIGTLACTIVSIKSWIEGAGADSDICIPRS